MVRLDADAAEPGGADALQIGALVKMRTHETLAFGMVKSLTMPDYAEAEDDGKLRVMEIEFVGEGVPGPEDGTIVFRRGVSFCPTLGDSVFAVSQDDLMRVYAQPNVASAKIGTIYQDQTLPAFVSVDDLIGKHFAVLGTTGCGKSCAMATMLRAILDQHAEGHVVLLDLHDEYSHAFKDCAELIGGDRLKLPYWMLSSEELEEIVVEKSEDEEVDRSILRDSVVHAKRAFNEDDERVNLLGADSPVPYRLSELIRYLNESLGRLDKPTDSAPYLRLINRLTRLTADKRFEFMFEERFTVADTMAEILAQLYRVPAQGKPITVLDLSEVPSDVMKVVISLICRLTFDFAFWANRETPVLLVCEEAHRYANQLDEDSSYRLIRRALSRIVNEGRKHGVSLGIVSQRPSELDMGILSQCNTIFAMRMSNLRDQEFVQGTLSESALGLTDALPSLRTGEAVAVGEGVSLPVRVYFDLLPEDQRPRSATAEFSKAWKTSEGLDGYVDTIVDRWRRQRR
ncbi:MAG: ATP-binding protein [Alphaproteobacteria bacterium]|nr:ATP-binding protein [Alphaproteobacteria bacterium]